MLFKKYTKYKIQIHFCFVGHYPKDEIGKEQRRIFETANRYHFIHTLALLGLPLCRVPHLV
jgi:uncharacterized membrane protein YgdD (TMEM256/DUF423 family)